MPVSQGGWPGSKYIKMYLSRFLKDMMVDFTILTNIRYNCRDIKGRINDTLTTGPTYRKICLPQSRLLRLFGNICGVAPDSGFHAVVGAYLLESGVLSRIFPLSDYKQKKKGPIHERIFH
jgi:hypothetical protein